MADALQSDLSSSIKYCVNLAKESESSFWLTVLSILEHGFHLHKGDLEDALSLCYGITPSNTSSTCQCGTSFSVDHAMVCPFGGFPTIRHNKIEQLLCSLKCVMMLQQNHLCSQSLQRLFLLHLPIPLMILTWMLRPGTSGVGPRMFILMLGYFTPMLPATTPLALLLFINAMKMQRSENTVIELGTLSMESSLHWSLLLLVAWDIRLLYFIGI